MSLVDYFKALKFRFNKYPSHLILFVTAGCNARCKHCFYWREIEQAKQHIELSLDEIRKVSANMGHIKFLSITGGEPSLRNDLPEIISTFCDNNQTQNVVLHTNGYLTEKIRDNVIRVAEANPQVEVNVSVSIDAMSDLHDLIRGVPGIFENAIASIDALKQVKERYPNVNVTVNTCYNSHNCDDVGRLSDYLFEHHSIDGYYLSWVRGEPFDRESNSVDIHKYLEETNRLLRRSVINRYYDNYPLASLRRTLDFLAPQIVAETVIDGKMPYPCMAGKSVIVISESGEVKPCEMLKESFGNVRDHDYDVKKMLFSPEGVSIKKNIANGACCCTWECAVMNNLVFNWRSYPRVFMTWFILEFEKRFGR